jgi:hypothetical protein
MSLERPVECPPCRGTQTVTVWDSLNATVSHQAREDRNGPLAVIRLSRR